MSAPKQPKDESAPPAKKRKARPRPIPQWLKQQQDLNEMARRRCLMILNVLSGALPVSEAIEEAKISRGLYYQLETKAVRAMLAAMQPGSDATGEPAVSYTEKITQLEQKVARLEQDKRRAERLLFVTRQVVRPGPVAIATGRGRPRKDSTKDGVTPSPSSTTTTRPAASAAPSTATTDGEGAR